MTAPDYKIVIMVCYYGSFPWYFKYFLHSCKFNPTVNFIIFTDLEYEQGLPKNVAFVKKSLNEIKILAADKLGYAVAIDTPYKLCDYKPVLGLLFSDYLQGYDFWGQSDIDVIYGDIRGFLTNDLLATYDFVSSRNEWATGCFTLFRNNELMNNIFKRGKDCQKVFADPEYRAFDEFNFLHCEISEERTVWDIKTEIDTFTHIVKAAARHNEINAYFEFLSLEGTPGKIKFDNGKVIYKNTLEAMLYHLYWLKRVYNPSRLPKELPGKYFISPTRIYY
jgi:hypothetical protein